MPVHIEMSFSDAAASDEDVPDAESIQRWVEQSCFCEQPVVVSVRVVSSDEMRELNRTWRGIDKPTNVLSFPMESPAEVNLNLLGDLAVCASVIEQEARQQHKPVEAHWAHMLVHGVLHLQGFDHIEEAQAAEMEALEIRILGQLGFNNPYLGVDDQQFVESKQS